MIRAVVFDCFGVLASDGWLPFKARYFEDNPELSLRASLLNKAVDAGTASFDAFISEVASMSGQSDETTRRQIENNIPDQGLFSYIQELKPRYKIGLLSNAGDNWLNDIFTPEQIAMFDATAFSYELHATKPDPRTYITIAERLETPPDECIFIDDQPRYVDGANAVGMLGILYTDSEQLKQDLNRLLTDA